MNWFPRPNEDGDVEPVPRAERWVAEVILQVLQSPVAQEWKDRVGVAGPRDGSAKATTRLLAGDGWVIKTNVGQTFESRGAAVAAAMQERIRSRSINVCHPSKHWAVMSWESHWLALTICPEVVTLRGLETFRERTRGWLGMILLAVRVVRDHGVGLDLNPANFGFERGSTQLYYIDDEFYPSCEERELAWAMASRIPEESEAPATEWHAWGVAVAQALMSEDASISIYTIAEEVDTYPLSYRFEESRKALKDGLLRATRARSMSSSPAGKLGNGLTCVFADVHANLPALEAVLAEAREIGVRDYLFLGDIVGYGPHPAACIERLAALPNSIILRGNHDHAVATGHLELGMNPVARSCAEWTTCVLDAEAREWLGNLRTEVTDESWMAVHGAPRDPRRFRAYVYDLTHEDNISDLRRRGLPLCFHGHTHVAAVRSDLGTLRGPALAEPVSLDRFRFALANPGSVGQPRDGDPRAAFAIWRPDERQLVFRRVNYPVYRTVQDLHNLGLPAELERRLIGGS